MMSFSGSQSEPIKKMERGSLNAQKHTSGQAPKVCSVFGVRCAILPVRTGFVAGRSPDRRRARSLAPVGVAAGTAPVAACGALVDTSVNLKPTELVDVALDMLARLTPCLNLGVGKLGHKDLLDTIGTDNCRK